MKTRKMTLNPTRNNRKKEKNNPEKICKTNESFVMAVGKKKKEEIDKNRRKQTNLLEFSAKNKEKRKKTRQTTLLLTHFDEKIFSRAFFSSPAIED